MFSYWSSVDTFFRGEHYFGALRGEHYFDRNSKLLRNTKLCCGPHAFWGTYRFMVSRTLWSKQTEGVGKGIVFLCSYSCIHCMRATVVSTQAWPALSIHKPMYILLTHLHQIWS